MLYIVIILGFIFSLRLGVMMSKVSVTHGMHLLDAILLGATISYVVVTSLINSVT